MINFYFLFSDYEWWSVTQTKLRSDWVNFPDILHIRAPVRWQQQWVRARYLYVIAKWLGYSSPQDTTNTAGPTRRALSPLLHFSFSSTYLCEPEKMKIPTRPYFLLLLISLTKVKMTHSYNYSIRIGKDNDEFFPFQLHMLLHRDKNRRF